MSDDHSIIAPEPTVAHFKGRTVPITPLTVGQLPAFARAVRPFADKVAAAAESFSLDTVLGLIADHGEQLLEAVSIATRIKRSEINGADPAELIALIAPVLKVNADFFVRLLAKFAPAAMAGLKAANGAGPTASAH